MSIWQLMRFSNTNDIQNIRNSTHDHQMVQELFRVDVSMFAKGS